MPKYNQEGIRLTDCCGAMSTYSEEFVGEFVLCCKKCWEKVPIGQGDGNEKLSEVTDA